MPSCQIENAVGVLTTAVLCYSSYIGGSSVGINRDFCDFEGPLAAPVEMKFDPHWTSNDDWCDVYEQIGVIHQFASNILDNIKDLDPEFSRTVDENFWDLI